MSPRKPTNGPSATRVASTPVPKITKGKRSARRRINQTVVHNDDLSAMHILANIAGEILEENALMNENPKPQLIKPEPLDQDSCSEAGLELPSPPIIITKESNSNLPPLVSSGSTEEMPLYRENIARNEENRDCGDNTSGCTQTKAVRANSRVSKKIVSKKVSPGKYRAPNGDDSCSHAENKPAFCESKLFYTRQRTQFKKQKQFEHCSAFNHEVKKEGKKENVKLNIKSVKIPELALEVSETSTVASLKKRVLEAIAAMLGKELDIGVTLQGTKFQDENLNLTQAGINQVEKLNDLDFSLELKSKSSQDNSHVTVEKPISAQLPTPNPNPIKIPNLNPNPNPLSPSLNCHESEIDSVPSPNSPNESKAIVVHPMHMEMETEEPLAVIPAARKLKRVEPVGQRRIRRPFSVGEVEALVQAVEKLGTGRWRDVKIRAFDDAKHRTYVDLKDKWKTLVHTASIAPQQRRGEPVPQDLLDRVLAAQSYWTQEQAMLQLKGSETCLLVQN